MRNPLIRAGGAGFRADRRGSAALEFAVVVPVITTLLMGVSDAGLAFLAKQQVESAARAASNYASAHPEDSAGIAAAGTAAVKRSVAVTTSSFCGCAAATTVATQSCSASCTSGIPASTYVRVVASSSYSPIFPAAWKSLLGNNVLSLSSTVTVRTQ